MGKRGGELAVGGGVVGKLQVFNRLVPENLLGNRTYMFCPHMPQPVPIICPSCSRDHAKKPGEGNACSNQTKWWENAVVN